MYLPSYLTMDCSPVTPDSTANPFETGEVDEVAMEIAKAHAGLRFLAKYCKPEHRARLEAALCALREVDSTVTRIQEEARAAEKAEG